MKNEYKIYNGDCIEVIKSLSQESVDAIITDPPYNISRKNNFNTMGRSGIDFGEWDKVFNLTSWIGAASSMLRKGGNIVIFNDWKNMTTICDALEANGFDVKDQLRWEKTNPMPRNRDRRFITDFENAVWAIKKGAKWTFNRKDDNYERPLIKCSITSAKEKSLGSHTTQKPIKVMEWIIERLTNEGDIVLDPFMGSGTTGVACQQLNRKFIGIEKSKDYYDLAAKRLLEYELCSEL